MSQVVSRPQQVTRVTYSAPQTVSFTPAISSVVRPQVTRVTQSSGASGLTSRNNANIVTSVLNTLSPTIQAAVARYVFLCSCELEHLAILSLAPSRAPGHPALDSLAAAAAQATLARPRLIE